MNHDEIYKFISESTTKLKRIADKKIEEILSVHRNSSQREYSTEIKSEEECQFSFCPSRIYVLFEDFGTLAFANRGRDHRSLAVAHLPEAPSVEIISRDLYTDRPFTVIKADDPVYSEAYFADFLGTHVVKLETIQAHETGRRGARRNERGLRITNEKGRSLIIGWKIQCPIFSPGMCIIKPEQLNSTPGLFTFHEI